MDPIKKASAGSHTYELMRPVIYVIRLRYGGSAFRPSIQA